MFILSRAVIVGRREESGFTLVESLVVLSILAVVVAISLNFLVTADNTVNVATERSSNNAQARLVLSQIDATVRDASNVSIANGNLYIDSSLPSTSGFLGSREPLCVEWAVVSGGLAEYAGATSTSWYPTTPITTWQGVTAAAGPVAFSSSPATTGTPTTVPLYPGLVNVNLLVNQHPAVAGSGVDLTDSIAASNMTSAVNIVPSGSGPPTCPANA